MTRAAHPIELVNRAVTLRSRGFTYAEIKDELLIQFNVSVGYSTVRDWVTYHSRPLAQTSHPQAAMRAAA